MLPSEFIAEQEDGKNAPLDNAWSLPAVGDSVMCHAAEHKGEREFWVDDVDYAARLAYSFNGRHFGCDGHGGCKLETLTVVDDWEDLSNLPGDVTEPTKDVPLPVDAATKVYEPWKAGAATHFAFCRHDPTPVVTVKEEGWTLWAASRGNIDTLAPFELVLNCCGSSVAAHHKIPEKFSRLVPYAADETAKEIVLDWPDMGAPSLPAAFWRELAAEVRLHKSVLVFCIGGHGRTGTALTCLLMALCPHLSAAECLAFICKNYCNKCVESRSQEQYIEAVEKKLKEKP